MNSKGALLECLFFFRWAFHFCLFSRLTVTFGIVFLALQVVSNSYQHQNNKDEHSHNFPENPPALGGFCKQNALLKSLRFHSGIRRVLLRVDAMELTQVPGQLLNGQAIRVRQGRIEAKHLPALL